MQAPYIKLSSNHRLNIESLQLRECSKAEAKQRSRNYHFFGHLRQWNPQKKQSTLYNMQRKVKKENMKFKIAYLVKKFATKLRKKYQ